MSADTAESEESPAAAEPGRSPSWVPAAAVVVAFVATRIFFYGEGIEFDASTRDHFWQYLDPSWLAADLGRSIFYLHGQPPMLNLTLGVMDRLFGDSAPTALAVAFRALGLALHLGLYGLMVEWGVERKRAAIATAVFACLPVSILYENWLFYTYPVATMLVGLVLSVAWAIRTGRTSAFASVAALLALIALTRAAMHLVWVIAVLLLVLRARRDVGRPSRRHVRAAALAAVLVVTALYAKNAVVFGFFGASSWMGMNIAKLTHRIPEEERERLIAEGVVTELVRIHPFSPLDEYAGQPALEATPPSDIPALTAPLRPNDHTNYHHYAYIELSRIYRRDALAILTHAPEGYVEWVGRGFAVYGFSPMVNHVLGENPERIRGWIAMTDRWVYGIPEAFSDDPRPRTDEDDDILLSYVGYTWLVLGLLGMLWAAWRVRAKEAAASERASLQVALLTIVYVTLVVNLFEFGENNRMRVLVDPLIYALIIASLAWVERSVRARTIRAPSR